MVYEFKTDGMFTVSAKVAGEVCQHLEETGGLTAKRLLDASRPEDAPLHGEFLWDDTEAAERYRESQAAHIIRCLVVRPEPKVKEPVRAFINVSDQQRSYQSVDVVLQKPDLRKQMLDQALKDLRAFESKYSTLHELASVFEALHQLEKDTE